MHWLICFKPSNIALLYNTSSINMKKIILGILATISLAPSFATNKTKKQVNNSPIVSVTIQHTACYGKCPEYTIQIDADGYATYTGTRNMKQLGTYKKKIGTTKTMAIINQMIAYKVDTCSKMYNNRIPDLPGLQYAIQYKDSVHKIYSAEWGPQFLKQVANDMDKLGRYPDKTWTKVKKAVKQ